MVEPEVDRGRLWNEIEEGKEYPTNEKWYSHLLDQYKLYVEMADRVSARRATANTFYQSINAAILAFVGYLNTKDASEHLWLVAAAGVALCALWFAMIRQYRNLNSAKWEVVQKIEKRLPISPYDAEWEAMGRGRDPQRYRPLSHIEMAVPWVFLALHAFVFYRLFPWHDFWCIVTVFRQPPAC